MSHSVPRRDGGEDRETPPEQAPTLSGGATRAGAGDGRDRRGGGGGGSGGGEAPSRFDPLGALPTAPGEPRRPPPATGLGGLPTALPEDEAASAAARSSLSRLPTELPAAPPRGRASTAAAPPTRSAGSTPDAAPVGALGPGVVLADRYELGERLGQGGMGEVYRARDRVRGLDIALKAIRRDLLEHPSAARRFEVEAEVSLRLSHPGVVRVYDTGVDAGTGIRFLTMELLSGRSLRAWLDQKKARKVDVRPEQALAIARQVLRALQHAHQRTIHRDVKPENIFLCDDPDGARRSGLAVKLLDFGVAKLMTPDALTRTSVALGTAWYMAPEQGIDAARVDARADLYAIGAVLYEMLTGRLPAGSFAMPSAVRADLPAGIDLVIRRALAPDPDDRFPSAQAFLEALGRLGEAAADTGVGGAGGAGGAGAATEAGAAARASGGGTDALPGPAARAGARADRPEVSEGVRAERREREARAERAEAAERRERGAGAESAAGSADDRDPRRRRGDGDGPGRAGLRGRARSAGDPGARRARLAWPWVVGAAVAGLALTVGGAFAARAWLRSLPSPAPRDRPERVEVAEHPDGSRPGARSGGSAGKTPVAIASGDGPTPGASAPPGGRGASEASTTALGPAATAGGGAGAPLGAADRASPRPPETGALSPADLLSLARVVTATQAAAEEAVIVAKPAGVGAGAVAEAARPSGGAAEAAPPETGGSGDREGGPLADGGVPGADAGAGAPSEPPEPSAATPAGRPAGPLVEPLRGRARRLPRGRTHWTWEFDRAEEGLDWVTVSGRSALERGALVVEGAAPAVVRLRLPARVEQLRVVGACVEAPPGAEHINVYIGNARRWDGAWEGAGGVACILRGDGLLFCDGGREVSTGRPPGCKPGVVYDQTFQIGPGGALGWSIGGREVLAHTSPGLDARAGWLLVGGYEATVRIDRIELIGVVEE